MTTKMPEWLVLARLVAGGFAIAELFTLAASLGVPLRVVVERDLPFMRFGLVAIAGVIVAIYAMERGIQDQLARITASHRADLFAAFLAGVGLERFVSIPALEMLNENLKNSSPYWALTAIVVLCSAQAGAVVASVRDRRKPKIGSPYFLGDEEIQDTVHDLLNASASAESFAKAVIASGTNKGIVFGIDGPWGVGKTSFINLAERNWKDNPSLIICRFEPLRYASDANIADRMLQDIVKAIHARVFAPEFKPAASRYARMIKGNAEFSFFGLKLALSPSAETADDLLEDIDSVLARIGRRLILVVDDLDRLDPKALLAILFATRQTFRLSHATVILSYDTEMIRSLGSDGAVSRSFLEKFVTLKISLLVDLEPIQSFLEHGWAEPGGPTAFMSADSIQQLTTLLRTTAEILKGPTGAAYRELLGDLRKVKRYVNSLRLLQLDSIEIERTGFELKDVIHLVMLNVCFPEVFRRIYAEETEGRSGPLSSIHGRRTKDATFDSAKIIEEYCEPRASFLLRQLFDPEVLKLGKFGEVDEATIASRACFNTWGSRTLERFLKLIVRVIPPPVQETYALYAEAVANILAGGSVEKLLSGAEFDLANGSYSHDQFWRILVDSCRGLRREGAADVVATLVKFLPRYPFLSKDNIGMRQRGVYSLVLLMDRIGWTDTKRASFDNSKEHISEIADWVLGRGRHFEDGILNSLADRQRGILGLYDMLLFRLQCSADRQGQIFNLQSALVFDDDENAQRGGYVSEIARTGMRAISQYSFAIFKARYITPGINFLGEVSEVSDAQLIGAVSEADVINPKLGRAVQFAAARTTLSSFITYQLSNAGGPQGSGVGCGYYDEFGKADRAGIAEIMNQYLFERCFNLDLADINGLFFLDHCLSHLTSPIFSRGMETEYVAVKSEMLGGLNEKYVLQYWQRNAAALRSIGTLHPERQVVTPNYVATYSDDLPQVLEILEQMAVLSE